jgi:hypothetical protein
VTSLLEGDVFVGRKAELAQLAEMAGRVRQGQPWLVTIEGESGVGKTALARRLMAHPDDLTLLWAQADRSETDLDYGIIGQLVRGMDRRVLARYPLLSGDMVRATPFAVGAEFLGLVGAQQRAGLLALVIDDMQWADRRSAEALSFTFRRLSVDAVTVIAIIRGDRDQLDAPARQLLLSMTRRQRIVLSGLSVEDVEPLAVALGAGYLGPDAIRRLHDRTGGHTLYLRTMLSDTDGLLQAAVPPSLAAAIGDQLATLPAPARSLLEMLAVVNGPVPLALLGTAAQIEEPTAAIQPALRAGLAGLVSDEPVRPVAIRHALQREALYAALTADRRRELHAKAVTLVDAASGWAHRVAALDHPDEGLAAELEQLAGTEAASGRLALAATHLQWAAGISPAQADRERRLLTAALHLALGEEARGLILRESVEAAAPSPLRSCVLGTMAFSAGQPREAEMLFSEALAQTRHDPGSQPLAAVISNRLSGTYTVLGDGEKVMTFARQALGTGCLDEAAASQTRTLVAIGASQVAGSRAADNHVPQVHRRVRDGGQDGGADLGIEPEPAEVDQREQHREQQRPIPAVRLPGHDEPAERNLPAHLREQPGRDEPDQERPHDRDDHVRQPELEQQRPDQRRGSRRGRHQPHDEHLSRRLHPLIVRDRSHADGLDLTAHPAANGLRALRFVCLTSHLHHHEDLAVSRAAPAQRVSAPASEESYGHWCRGLARCIPELLRASPSTPSESNPLSPAKVPRGGTLAGRHGNARTWRQAV